MGDNVNIEGHLTVGRNTTIGGRAIVRGDAQIDHNLKVKGWLEADNIKDNNKGVFGSESALQAAYPSPLAGWYAGVYSETGGAHIQMYRVNNGAWTDAGCQYMGAGDYPEKADKVIGATEGNLAALNDDGNLLDSGKKPSDFALDGQVVKTVPQSLSDGQKAQARANIGAVSRSELEALDNELETLDGQVVKTVQQSLNNGQKEQARANIGAASESELETFMSDYRPIEIHGDVTNAPDEEDLTSVNAGGTEVIRFKDKSHAPALYSGKGRKYLRKNVQDVGGVAKNIMTQDMFYKGEVGHRVPNTDTIFIVQYDFDLNNQTVTIPSNCILKFEGGSIFGGVLKGNDTIIEGDFNAEEISGTFIKDGQLICPESYFKFDSDIDYSSFVYYYIDTQSAFRNFCIQLMSEGTPIYGIMAPKTFMWWYPWGDTQTGQAYLSYRWLKPLRNFELVGTNGSVIEGYEEIYTRKDAVAFDGNWYKCPIKTNARYTEDIGLGYFPVFMDENNNLVKVQKVENPAFGCLSVPTGSISDCKYASDYATTKGIIIPIDDTLGDEWKNKTFTNAFGAIKCDYRYVYFKLNSSDSINFYCTAIYDPYNGGKALNSDAVLGDYSGDKVYYILYNAAKDDSNSIYYDDSYIYIPNQIKELKFLGSTWAIDNGTVKDMADRWIDHQGQDVSGESIVYDMTIRNIRFEGFGHNVLHISARAGQTTNNNVVIEDCVFSNCIKSAIVISISQILTNAATWKGIMGSIRNCDFVSCCINPPTIAQYVVNVKSMYNDYPTTPNASFTEVLNCRFKNLSSNDYYFSQKIAVGLNSDSEVSNCSFDDFTQSIFVQYGIVTISNNEFKISEKILSRPQADFLHDAGIIYISQLVSTSLIDTNRLVDNRHRATIRGNCIYPIVPASYGTRFSYSGIYIDDGRGNVVVDNNLVGPIGGKRFSIECRNITVGTYADGYSSNRVVFSRNIVFNAYRMTHGSSLTSDNAPYVENNIVITGEYMDVYGELVNIDDDLPRPQYYYYDGQSVVLPYNYIDNFSSSFPTDMKFLSIGGTEHVNNPVFGSTRPLKPYVGQQFFDKSLSPAKYICWNGTAWVNMDGTSLT